ncbi:DnaJ domain-containing protein [Endogone sp. FLAS-F59071]|nr:DnaJ domain-containing protein [Endogone sp. FLAS-F59071]|eukprot:RUS15217.1 DnaJ domain-containing protein [Endogone sp. FLAS-F59071]
MDLREVLKDTKNRYERGEINEGQYEELKGKILSEYIKTKRVPEATSLPLSHTSTELYQVLGLQPNATEQEIRQSYHKLSLKHHPDKNKGTETEVWYKVSQAYEVLSNKDKRAVYDRFGPDFELIYQIPHFIASKEAAFNMYVSGDPWVPYIGELELGFLVISFTQQGKEMENAKEINRRQHLNRISILANYLKDKISKYAKHSTKPQDISQAQTPFIKGTNKIVWNLGKSEIMNTIKEVCDLILDDQSIAQAERNNSAEFLKLLGNIWVECSKVDTGKRK